MLVYFEVFLLTLILQGILPSYNAKSYKWRIFITLIPLFLFGAFRVGEGDYLTYKHTFEFIHSVTDLSLVHDHYEFGYVRLCSIIPTFRLLVVLVSFMMCLGYGTLMYRFVPPRYLWIAIVLLFLSANNSVYFILQTMRNGLAASLLMLAVPYIQLRKKSIFIYALMGILAWSIHTSALLAFGIALVVAYSDSRFTRKEMWVWVGVIAFFLFVSTSGLLDFISPYINEYFDRYDPVLQALGDAKDHKGILAKVGALIIMIPAIIFLRKAELTTFQRKLFRLFLVYCLSYIMGIFNTRLTQYFCPFMFMAVPIMYMKMKSPALKNLYLGFIICFISYAMYLWTISEWFTHSVYHHIFE